jgi:translation initiation factor 6
MSEISDIVVGRYIKHRQAPFLMDEHIAIMDFDKNPNLGLYAYACDGFCLVGKGIERSKIQELHATLKVPVHEVSLAGTPMVGLFCVGVGDHILVPGTVFEHELAELRKLGINYTVIQTAHTALGNNILVNTHCALVNPEMEKEAKAAISTAFKVPVVEMKIAGLPIVGALGVLRKGFALVHHDIEDFEKKLLETKLKVKITSGSVNMGSPYVKSGLIANANGFCVGSMSGGPEIDHIDHALGYLEE